jgi:ribose-phosphate pyrophosphokinase
MKTQKFVVVAGSYGTCSQQIAQRFGAPVVRAQVTSFGDGEVAVQLPDDFELVRGKTALVVQQFSFDKCFASQNSYISEQIFRFLLLVHQVKAYGAKNVIAVLPYLPYVRQARSACGTYVGPLEAFGRFVTAAGVDQVVTSDIHEQLCHSLFPIPILEMTLADFWKQQLSHVLRRDEVQNLCFVSPDRGGIGRVKEMAYLCGAEWAFVEKKRLGHNVTQAVALVGDVRDKVVVMIDDIIDTAITATEACKMVVEYGARKVIGCFSHAVFSPGAISRIEKSGFEQILITNSVGRLSVDLGEKITIVSIDRHLGVFAKKVVQSIMSEEFENTKGIGCQPHYMTKAVSRQL